MFDDIKEKIISDLEFNIPVSYRRYGITNHEFKQILNEMKDEGIILFELYHNVLPNGDLHPYHGDPINIRLKK